MRIRRQIYPSHTAPIKKEDLKTAYEDVGNVVNGNIEFGSPTNPGAANISGSWATVTTPNVANTEFAVQHTLQRVPTGFLTVSIDAAGILYRSATPWTSTTAFLKCNIASANIVIFIT